jgi:O-acetylserine/cysteine efflux transporter
MWHYTICGFFIFGLNFMLFGFGLQTSIAAGLASFVTQLQVFFGILACFLVLGEKPTWFQNVGLLVSFIGVYFLQMSSSAADFPLEGVGFLMAACISVGIGVALSKKYKVGGTLEDITWFAVTSAVLMLFACLVFEGPGETVDQLIHISPIGFCGALFGAVIGTVWGNYLWLRVMTRNQASSVFPFFLLIPIFSNLFSHIFLAERLSELQVMAGLTIITGLLFSQGIHQHVPLVIGWVKQRVTS